VKRIVLCFDGTWNKPADDKLPVDRQVETNVRRFYESVHSKGDDGVRQVSWYNAGVGTEWYNRLTGGAFGSLLDQHILDGYRTLVHQYEDGDEIYILGFSRGAYTARSLVGMIRNCGLVESGFLNPIRIGTAYGIYRTRDDGVDSETATSFRSHYSREVKIKFVGVWDTVGALGIPLEFVEKLNAQFYQFHDTRLSSIVENACQAIALDEHRGDYDICLWSPSEQPDQPLEQRWFCGAHCDVGGGYPDRSLSDLALRWMEDKAAALGLALTRTAADPEGYQGTLTDSYAAFLDGAYAKVKKPHYRAVLSTKWGNEVLDPSIGLRRKDAALDPIYGPKNEGLPALV
jgi:uncharacterized protein (DUF2235 family)